MEDVGIEAGAPLATHMGALLEARRDSSLPADPEPAFAAGAARVLELKAAHRRLCDATDTLREAAAEAKTQLDTSSLQLQVGGRDCWGRQGSTWGVAAACMAAAAAGQLWSGKHYRPAILLASGSLFHPAHVILRCSHIAAFGPPTRRTCCMSGSTTRRRSAAAAAGSRPSAMSRWGRCSGAWGLHTTTSGCCLGRLPCRVEAGVCLATRGMVLSAPRSNATHPLPPLSLTLLPFAPAQIALVPLEEFASHPLAAEGGLSEESDPHQLMLNRLKHEVAYRWAANI